MFKLLELVEQPYLLPDRSIRNFSEDIALFTPNLIAIADGASGIADRRILDSYESDAQWISHVFIKALKEANKKRTEEKSDDIWMLLKNATDIMISRYKEEEKLESSDIKRYELPTTALTLAMLHYSDHNKVTFVNISGGPIFYQDRLVPGSKTLKAFDRHFLEMVKERQKQGKDAKWFDKDVFDIIKPFRNARNTPEGHAVVDLGYDWLNHPDTKIVEAAVNKGDKIFMCSDGLSRLYETYMVKSTHQFATEAFSVGLEGMLKELRCLELDDWNRVKYPRLKETDDVCAMTVEII